jgi:hypothetical protein
LVESLFKQWLDNKSLHSAGKCPSTLEKSAISVFKEDKTKNLL